MFLAQGVFTYAQIFTEDFSGGVMPPDNWTVVGGGDENWKIYPFSNNGGGVAPEAAFAWGPPYFSGNSRLMSPLIATSGYTSLALEFNTYVWDFAGQGYTYSIATTSDNGATWNEVWSIAPTADVPAELATIVIENSDVGSDNFQFAFIFDGETTNINYWYMDDISLTNNTSETYAVSYYVEDVDGNPVENASVNMLGSGTLLTDAQGIAQFGNVFPGEYTWWATAPGLSFEEGMITVVDRDVSQDIVLSVSLELLAERFATGTFPPEGWSISGSGQSNWRRLFSNNAGEAYPELQFQSSPVFTGNSKFISPEVNTAAYEDLFLRFNHSLLDNVGSGYSIKVETTSDGGATWNEVWSRTPTGDLSVNSETILISNTDAGSDVFQFSFTFEGNSSNVMNWYIDDAVLTAARKRDAALVSVNLPSLTTPGVTFEPIVEVSNVGAEVISFEVTLEFTDGVNEYFQTVNVTDLEPLANGMVVFPAWESILGSFDGEVYINLLGDENSENDRLPFAIEVAGELVDKRPLYEMFTSSTCPPCPAANEALDGLLEENPDEYTLIKYQVNFPGAGDLYYTDECGTRSDYYGLFSVPDLYVNAERFSPPVNIVQADFDRFQDAKTALEIDITDASIDNDNIVSVSADLTSLVNYSAGLRAHIAVVEKVTTGNVGTNGELEFHHVMMKMLPDASGRMLEALVPRVKTTILEQFDMDLTNMEMSNDLAVIVFVQDDEDKSVVQSAMIDVSFNTNTKDLTDDEDIVLKPNPTASDFSIESKTELQKIEIFNQLGKLVATKKVSGSDISFNVLEYQSGVYYVKVYFEDGRVVTKNIVVE